MANPAGAAEPAPRVSIVIPTFNRSTVAVATVAALNKQTFSARFEVIVVVDGSTDDTAERLRALPVSFPLMVVEQCNSGASSARNRGAQVARGNLLLFLDDDMEADSTLVSEHVRCHTSGRELVVGHIPLHPASPASVLLSGVEAWAQERLRRLTAPDTEPGLNDVLTGQLSISKEAFEAIGGFDRAFTRNGAFGNEDLDFGFRARQNGLRVVFNPKAVSWQRYVVRPEEYLRQRRDLGRADVALVRKHPERKNQVFASNGSAQWKNRFIWRPIVSVPLAGPTVTSMLASAALAMTSRRPSAPVGRRVFKAASFAHYWSGVRDGGGVPHDDPPRVLCYHAIREISVHSPLAPYTISPTHFEHQIDSLLEAGFTFVDADAMLGYLRQHRPLPLRAVLLTFDDCYVDLLESALPILRERHIPAVAFAVSGRVDGVNTWDLHLGGPPLRLLDGRGLRTLARGGVEIGAHSRTHPVLPHVSEEELAAEVEGCLTDIEALGLPRPRLFSYPYGESDERVERALESSGIEAAFTVRPGAVAAELNRLRLPRIPIFSNDTGARFARTVSVASGVARFQRSVSAMSRDLTSSWRHVLASPAAVIGEFAARSAKEVGTSAR